MTKRKGVILFLVEGFSDKEALDRILNAVVDEDGVFIPSSHIKNKRDAGFLYTLDEILARNKGEVEDETL